MPRKQGDWEIWKIVDSKGEAHSWTLTEARNAKTVLAIEKSLAAEDGETVVLCARLFDTTWNHAKTVLELLQIGEP